MTRSRILPLTALLGAGILLAGCAGTTDTASDSDGAELTYAIWDSAQEETMQAIIDEFEAENPGITVDLQVIPGVNNAYWNRMNVLAQSSDLPDVFWMSGPYVQLYASNDQLLPLDDISEATPFDESDYPQSMIDLYTYDSSLYGVPKDFDTVGVYYNRALLDQAGVAEPTAAWTWDDVFTMGEAVRDALGDDGVYGFAGDVVSGQQSWYNTVIDAGGEIISADGTTSGYDSPEAIAGLQFWRDLIAQEISPSMEQLSTTAAPDWFTSGRLAMVAAGDWQTGRYAEALGDDLGVVSLPHGPASNSSVLHGVANSVAATTDAPEAAELFAAYLGGESAAVIQAEAGAVIPAFNGSQAAFVDTYPGLDVQLFLDAADTATAYPISRNTSAWNDLESELLPQAFSGARPVEDVAAELATQMNALLAEER